MTKKILLFLTAFTLFVAFSGSLVFAEQVYNPDFKIGSVEIKDNGKYVRFKVNFAHQNTSDMKSLLKYVTLPFTAILAGSTTPITGMVIRNTTIKGSYIYFAFDHLKQSSIKPCNVYSLKTLLGKPIISTPDKIEETVVDNNQSLNYFHTNSLNIVQQDSETSGTLPMDCSVVVTSGKLTGAVSASTPNSSIILAGDTNVPAAEYKFTTENEAFTIKKLDVVIDTNFSFSDDPSDDGASNNIKKVSLSYVKKDGTPETVSASLFNGKASFTDLNFYVPKDGNAKIKILADINALESGSVSGESFKLGLNEQLGAVNNSFEAIGEGSNEKKTVADLTSYAGSGAVKAVVVRKTMPSISKSEQSSMKLNNGQNDISAVKISAKEKGDIALKKMSFEFFANGNLDVTGLKLFKKQGAGGSEVNITNDVSITNAAGQDLKSGTKLAAQDTIYVTWNDQEFVTQGTMNTYILRASVANASANESVSTYMNESEQSIFTANASGLLSSVYKFVWSDLSANPHSLDSMDWTGGYLVPSFPTATWSLSF